MTVSTTNNTALVNYLLQLGDNSLILSQRLAELCGHGPVIEQDIALTNIALDLLGEARSYLQYAGELSDKTEDELAFIRQERAFRNVLLVELPAADYAHTIVRQFFFDAFHVLLLEALQQSKDDRIRAIAEKSYKEALYHVKWSSEWVIRLGDGTELSKQKMETALTALWPYTGEFFAWSDAEKEMMATGLIPSLEHIEANWKERVQPVLERATLQIPESRNNIYTGGKTGVHTEGMGYLLTDMQYLQRSYPGLQW